MDDETHERHRAFGVALFNDCWDLIERGARDGDDDLEMLLLAAASRWHWSRIGGPEQIANGDWQIAHVASLLGFADLALRFAEHNLTIAAAEGWDGWRLASAHEGMARACTAAGDAARREHHVELGRKALAHEDDAETRSAIAEQLDAVPEITGR